MNKCFVPSVVIFVIVFMSRPCLTFVTPPCQCWRQHWVYPLADTDLFVMAMKGRQWLSKMALYAHEQRKGKEKGRTIRKDFYYADARNGIDKRQSKLWHQAPPSTRLPDVIAFRLWICLTCILVYRATHGQTYNLPLDILSCFPCSTMYCLLITTYKNMVYL